jgi:hypothetical protein
MRRYPKLHPSNGPGYDRMPGHDTSSATPIAAFRSGIGAERHGDRIDAYAKKGSALSAADARLSRGA